MLQAVGIRLVTSAKVTALQRTPISMGVTNNCIGLRLNNHTLLVLNSKTQILA